MPPWATMLTNCVQFSRAHWKCSLTNCFQFSRAHSKCSEVYLIGTCICCNNWSTDSLFLLIYPSVHVQPSSDALDHRCWQWVVSWFQDLHFGWKCNKLVKMWWKSQLLTCFWSNSVSLCSIQSWNCWNLMTSGKFWRFKKKVQIPIL